MNISCGGKEKTNEESSVVEPSDVVSFFLLSLKFLSL